MPDNQTVLTLYHTGYLELQNPDIRHGRTNADFGQGFYTTENHEFALRWAKEKKGSDTIVNQYELTLSGLTVHTFVRDEDWFRYIYDNRNRMPDRYPEADVIIGPIANDTIFDTMGIITSGVLSPKDSLKLLRIGPEYIQVALKSEQAASQLQWKSARIMTAEELQRSAAAVAEEERIFMKEFAAVMESL